MEPPSFVPPFWARNAIVQTLVAQLPFRTWGKNEMVENERPEVVRLTTGINVEGIYSSIKGAAPKGLAILLSGWEGHARSPYMQRTGRSLYREGFEVFRLTYPDHGGTHDLNEAVFHFGMLDKVTEVLSRLVGTIRTRPVVVVGFSMGGNLALNVACRGLPGLKGVFAVSPPMDFARAMQTLESSVFHSTFLRQWKGSLERKQKLFPKSYDFKELDKKASVGQVADEVLSLAARAPSFADYASRYSLTPEKLRQLVVPAHVLTSTDDPMVGSVPYEQFEGNWRLHLHVQRYGGHVGFLTGLFKPAWYEVRIVELLRELLAPRPLLKSTGAAEAAPLPDE
jgi:predicted alpha/beta-fold hydrolase